MGNQGKPVVGIPRWLTTANLLGIVLAFTLAIPFGAHASHQGPPTGLVVAGRPVINASYAPTAAKLRWSDSALGTTEYALQRSTSSTFNASVVEVRIAKNTFEFWDETFTKVGTFYYRIRSISGADPSPFSNTATLVNSSGLALPAAAPSVPTELDGVVEGSGVRFSWKDNATTESFFRVERAAADAGAGQNLTWQWRGNVAAASGSGSRPSFLDTDPGAEPLYRVTAFNGKGSTRSYAFGPVHVVPGVDTQGVVSMINNLSSAVPTNLQSLVPSNLVPSDAVGTVNTIVSPFASTASGLTSAIPAASNVVSSVNALASQGQAIATGLASGVGPITSPWVSVATGLASGAAATVASVTANPTAGLPPVDQWVIWFSFRFGGTTYNPNLFLAPASCVPLNCAPPVTNPNFQCQPVPSADGIEYCFVIYTPTTRS
jgi:hypothetical protein